MKFEEFKKIVNENPQKFQLCFSKINAVKGNKLNQKTFSRIVELKVVKENVKPFYKAIVQAI